MADIKGPLTSLDLVLPAGLDGGRLAQWQLRDGSSYQQFRMDIATSLAGLNTELLQIFGDIIYITEEDHYEYENGGTTETDLRGTDTSVPVAKKTKTVGHHLPLFMDEDAIGGTKQFFRDARRAQLTANVRAATYRLGNNFERNLLTRMFNDSEDAEGSSGYAVGWASGSQSLSYTPVSHGGQDFASNHDHYIGVDDDSLSHYDLINELADEIHEHGHPQVFKAIVSSADASSYRALKNFIQPVEPMIVLTEQGGLTSTNRYFSRGSVEGRRRFGFFHIGGIQTDFGVVELHATSRVNTGYASVFKSYGMNNPDNPIHVRVHPDGGGFGVRMNEIPSFDTTWPVKQIDMEFEYGIAVGMDRTAGAAGRLVSGGAWTDHPAF